MSESHAFIVERSLLGAVAALLPVPVLDDVLLTRGRRTLLREVAKRAGVTLDREALRILAGDHAPGTLVSVGGGLLKRFARITAAPLRLADRGRAALATFQIATLLDHHLRSEKTIDAKALRARIDRAIAKAPVGLDGLRHLDAYATTLRAAFDA